jgi:hypothetical protein
MKTICPVKLMIVLCHFSAVAPGSRIPGGWASFGLTDIHHQGFCRGQKDVHHGDHGAEAAAPPPVTLEFKAEIVERCRAGDRTIGKSPATST